MKKLFFIILSLNLLAYSFILNAENIEQTTLKSSSRSLFTTTPTQKEILYINKIIYTKLSKYDDNKLDNFLKISSSYKLNTTSENKLIITLIEKQITLLKNNRKLQENKEFETLLNSIKNWIKEAQSWSVNNNTLPSDFSDL